MGASKNTDFVTPAKARVYINQQVMDSGFRRNDDFSRCPHI